MLERVERLKVSGAQYVGGLIGQAAATQTSNSFAAMDVVGSFGAQFIGGFAGRYEGGSIINAYASGKILSPNAYGGGFAGQIHNNADVQNCYATGDVITGGMAGGFAGQVANSALTNCKSYGRVKTEAEGDSKASGGFVGSHTAASFSSCAFLRQVSYNYSYDTYEGIEAGGFPNLKVPEGNSPEHAFPYSEALFNAAMPFPMLRQGDGTIMIHYGDWPAELKLQTSLVYYEKYKNEIGGSTFGYYAVTSLTAEGGDLETGKSNSWELNTLRDEPCIEDGYAILTIYPLSKFDYVLNGDFDAGHKEQKKGTITIGDTAGDDTAVKLTDRVSLEFRNTSNGTRYTISNGKVYQLPFSLQMTDRNSAARFYNRLAITGYRNNEVIETFQNYLFFYCPDFAKNAINPDLGNKEYDKIDTPTDPFIGSGGLEFISVRSPRQLNALGRAGYYWNSLQDKDPTKRYYFKQEVEINYGIYVETYCGKDYKLMDTSSGNTYRNRPIGRPGGQEFLDGNGKPYWPDNFRHTYDGQSNKIVDYRCETYMEGSSGYQFTGLFGEVEQSTLKNIVMVASDPNDGKWGSGYVVSHYTGSLHPGTGALLGLNYVDIDDEVNPYAVVSNCSVSGYTVGYEPGYKEKEPRYAIGGLVGYNFAKIENSSAVSKRIFGNEQDPGRYSRYVGGLVGSFNGNASVTNCYAGGEMRVSKGEKKTTYMGGIAGGYDQIHGYGGSNRSITNAYSYMHWTDQTNVANTYPIISDVGGVKVNNAHYLKETIDPKFNFTEKNKGTEQNFKALSKRTYLANGNAFASGRADAENTYPWSTKLQGNEYSFPAMVKDAGGSGFVHYGDWPDGPLSKTTGHLAYYEKYDDDTVAARYVNDERVLAVVGAFDTKNERVITKAGYGVLELRGSKPELKIDGNAIVKGVLEKSGVVVEDGNYDLYALAEESEKLLLPTGGEKSKEIKFQFQYKLGEILTAAEESFFINGNFADALGTADLTTFKVRTAQQLQNMSTAQAGWVIKLDHDVEATETLGNIVNNGYTFDGGYAPGGSAKDYGTYRTGRNGQHIFGLQNPLFASISKPAKVENLALIGAKVSAPAGGAALAVTNEGSIDKCFVTGTVTGGSVGGLVLTNNGSISRSYANVVAKATSGAAGAFVNNNSGEIYNCYALGSVEGSGIGSGFVAATFHRSSIYNCYSLATIAEGSSKYGFAPSNTGITSNSCFWAKDNVFNSADVVGGGTEKTLAKMKTLWSNGGTWTRNNSGRTWSQSLAGNYPYMGLVGLDHCGEWPVGRGVLGVGRVRVGNEFKGLVIDLNKTTDQARYSGGSSGQNEYVIVFDQNFEASLADWTLTYTYKSFWGDEYTSSVLLSDVRNRENGLDNVEGLTIKTFTLPKLSDEMVEMMLTSTKHGKYRFENIRTNYEYKE